MAEKTERMIPLYFIGIHYHPTKSLTFNVKSRIYQPERDEKGHLKIGGVMMVNEHDAKAIIDKSRVYRRNEGFFETFTLDAQIGAQVRKLAEQGRAKSVSARMTLEQALALAGQPSKEAVVAEMSISELEAALEAKRASADLAVSYIPVSDADVADAKSKPQLVAEPAEDNSDKPVEKETESPKNKPGRPPRDKELVDEIIAPKGK
jgi:hypothetical protein